MKPPCMDQRCLESQALLSGNLPFVVFQFFQLNPVALTTLGNPRIRHPRPMHRRGTSLLSFGGCNLTISTTLLLPCLIFCLLGVHQWHLILLSGRIWKARKALWALDVLRGKRKFAWLEIGSWNLCLGVSERGKRYQFTVLKDEPSSYFSKESKKSWGCFHNNTCIYLLILEPNDTSGRVSQVWFQLVKTKFPTTLYNQHQDTGWIIGLG